MPGSELIGEEERKAVNEVFDSGGQFYRYGFKNFEDARVRKFERRFAQELEAKYAHAVTSGTAALKVGLEALGIGRGDEVITQCFTFVATVEAIIECGAVPVVCNINGTLNMDPKDLEACITPRTKAIIPVHMLGGPCQMDEIMAIAKKHNLKVLEDTAQGVGGRYKGKTLGTIGEVGTFSFDVGKALTTGEGGMVVTNDEKLYLKARAYGDHGHEQNPNFPRGQDTRSAGGFNYRMFELQGALGLAQIEKLDYILKTQKKNKKMIKDGIRDIPGIRFREFADESGDTADTLVFTLESKEKASAFNKKFMEKGYWTKLLPESITWHFAGTWEHMLHNYDQYKGKDLMKLWGKSASLLNSSIAMPVLVKYKEEDIKKLVATIKEICSSI